MATAPYLTTVPLYLSSESRDSARWPIEVKQQPMLGFLFNLFTRRSFRYDSAGMGKRGEVFTTRLFIDEGRKTFFFNVKENRFMDRYINIVESRKTERGFKRSSLVVFDDDVQEFTKYLGRAMDKIRCREALDDSSLVVGRGRRTYRFHLLRRGKPALQLTEKREDATGSHRESIIVPVASFDMFRKSLSKALDAINKRET